MRTRNDPQKRLGRRRLTVPRQPSKPTTRTARGWEADFRPRKAGYIGWGAWRHARLDPRTNHCAVSGRAASCAQPRVRELELQSVHCPMQDRQAARGARRRDMGAGRVERCPDALVRAVSGRHVRDGAGAVRGLVRRTVIRWCLRGRETRIVIRCRGAAGDIARAPPQRPGLAKQSPVTDLRVSVDNPQKSMKIHIHNLNFHGSPAWNAPHS